MNKKNIKIYIVGILFLITAGSIFAFQSLRKVKSVDRPSGENVKVSVIVPVYNTEKYIDETFESLKNQTLKEIEIICVNDGSKDNSLEILKKHRENDNRIRIIDQKNSGVSVARNEGIKACVGKYVVFADSDDLIPPYAYQKAYEDAEKHNVDVVDMGLYACFNDGEYMDLNKFVYDDSKVNVLSSNAGENPFTAMNLEITSVCNKLWKTSFLKNNNLLFKPGLPRGEDALFNLMAFPFVNKIVKDNNTFYCYRQNRPNSALTEADYKKLSESWVVIAKELVNNYDRFNFENKDEWFLNTLLWHNYDYITQGLKETSDGVYFAKKFLESVDKNYVKKYNITPSEENRQKLEDLREIAYKK